MQKLLKNQVKEQLKNLTSNQRIPLLLEKNRVQRKFKNKLEKHLKNFKARVQKVRVQNIEKRENLDQIIKYKENRSTEKSISSSKKKDLSSLLSVSKNMTLKTEK
jgi:hypothetical protein